MWSRISRNPAAAKERERERGPGGHYGRRVAMSEVRCPHDKPTSRGKCRRPAVVLSIVGHRGAPASDHDADAPGTTAAGAPRTVTDKLQRVLNAAARVITGTRKFDRSLGQILHDQLHWLDVPDRVLFKLAVTVHQCLNGRAPPYLSEHCIPVSSADTRRHLRSANRHLLAVPRVRLNTYGCLAFSVAGPMTWNSLPDFIRDPASSTECFRRLLKTYLFARY